MAEHQYLKLISKIIKKGFWKKGEMVTLLV